MANIRRVRGCSSDKRFLERGYGKPLLVRSKCSSRIGVGAHSVSVALKLRNRVQISPAIKSLCKSRDDGQLLRRQ